MPSDAVVDARDLAVGPDPAAPRARGVDLTVAAGERVAFVAGNGAGKSALLATLACAAPLPAGRLRLFGRDPTRLDLEERAALRRRIGAALSEELWLPGAGAAENLALPLVIRGEDPRETAAVVGEFLRWLGLAARAATPLERWSAGERRLLATARAAVARPDLLLLDEPLAGLDAAASGRTAQLVRELAELGTAVLVATTDGEAARQLGCAVLTLGDDVRRAVPPALGAAR